jgi:hypothetical protein
LLTIVSVLDLAGFANVSLRGGLVLVEVRRTQQFLLDPLGRPAAAQTLITSGRLYIVLRDNMDDEESSISLYHEVLEAATVALDSPPDSVIEFNEGDFEQAARMAQTRHGIVTPETLNEMLAGFGFKG